MGIRSMSMKVDINFNKSVWIGLFRKRKRLFNSCILIANLIHKINTSIVKKAKKKRYFPCNNYNNRHSTEQQLSMKDDIPLYL